MFCDALMAIDSFLCKTATPAQLKENEQRLFRSFAVLEINLPQYWMTISRHGISHWRKKMLDLGFFWAQSLLFVERYHVLLKSMARGSRNMVRSIGHHYSLFDISQTDWRLQIGPEQWVVPPKHSTLAGAKEIPENQGLLVIKGKTNDTVLAADMFLQVKELWATEHKVFDKLFDRFNNDRRKRPPDVTLAAWMPKNGRRLNDEEKQIKCMSDQITVSFYVLSQISTF